MTLSTIAFSHMMPFNNGIAVAASLEHDTISRPFHPTVVILQFATYGVQYKFRRKMSDTVVPKLAQTKGGIFSAVL